MTLIDILLILPLLYGAYRGFTKGLIIEVATLVGLILGVFIAIRYSDYTEGILHDFLDISSVYLSYIALSVTFLLILIAVYLIGKFLTKLVDIVSLGIVNKVLGTLMGIAKYFIILCVILLIVNALDDKFDFISKETKTDSLLYNPFLNFAQKIYNYIRF